MYRLTLVRTTYFTRFLAIRVAVEEPVQVMSVGAVYDRAPFLEISEIRAVTDSAYRKFAKG
jgi:hypothetical protein